MGHHIIGILYKGKFDSEMARDYDLIPVSLEKKLFLFHIDHYYSACWQHLFKLDGLLEISFKDIGIFPREQSVARLMQNISRINDPKYAIIFTDYFGGIGEQYASVYIGEKNADLSVNKINEALRFFGVQAEGTWDEFDTVGLSKIRDQPDYLEKYRDLADKYGV